MGGIRKLVVIILVDILLIRLFKQSKMWLLVTTKSYGSFSFPM